MSSRAPHVNGATPHPPDPDGRAAGSQRWLDAVGNARLLGRAEKALCLAIVRHIDWTSGETFASMQTIADSAGWSVRCMQYTARRLEGRGILTPLSDGRGGRWPNGRGRSNRIRLELDELRRLGRVRGESQNPAPDAPLKGADQGVEGCTARPARVHGATSKGASGAPDQFQPSIQTTTTTTTISNADADVNAVTARGGGGGGMCSSFGQAEAGAAGGTLGAAAESRELLLGYGVTARAALALSAAHPPEVVRAGIEWVKRHAGPTTNSRAGLLVSILRDGTAHRAYEAARLQHAEREAKRVRLLQERRIAAVDQAFIAVTRQWTAPDGPEQRRTALARSIWGSTGALVAAGVVPDELLLAEVLDPRAITEAVWSAAERLAAGGSSDVGGVGEAGHSQEGGAR